MHSKSAELILENGLRFRGRTFGYTEDVIGEVVFSTAMTGYQEAITDPAYCGQIVVLTYPLVGNYGINLEDMESDKPSLSALVVRERCDYPNNFRTEMDLDGFLRQSHIVGIEGIDTRALTRTIRDLGCMKAIITTQELSDSEIAERFSSFDNSGAVAKVSTKEKYEIDGEGKHIAVIDVGTKKAILRGLTDRGCKVTVLPYNASAEEILSISPDGVLVSSGPGTPEDIPETVNAVKALIGKLPIYGICLGHLVVGAAVGCEITKLKFGHHGANQPVKNIKTGKVIVTAQNHNYVLENIPGDVEVSYVNINDGSCQGLCSEKLGIKTVQFRPEDYPSSHKKGNSVFDEFEI